MAATEASKLKYLNDILVKAAEDGAVFIKVTEENEQSTGGLDDSKFLQLQESADKSFELYDNDDDDKSDDGLGYGNGSSSTPVSKQQQNSDTDEEDIEITSDTASWARFFKGNKFRTHFEGDNQENKKMFEKLLPFIDNACSEFHNKCDLMNYFSISTTDPVTKSPYSGIHRNCFGYTWTSDKTGVLSDRQFLSAIQFKRDSNGNITDSFKIRVLSVFDIFSIIMLNYGSILKEKNSDSDFLKILDIETESIASIHAHEILKTRVDTPNVLYTNKRLRNSSQKDENKIFFPAEKNLFAIYLKKMFPDLMIINNDKVPTSFLFITAPKKLVNDK